MKRFGQIAKRIFIALCVMSAVCVIAWHYFGNHENSAATEEKNTAGVLVEKQGDEPMTDEAKAEDAAGGTVIPDDPAPDYVGFCDVRFFIENGERQRDTALYLNGKEAYVFLPSYADISNISIRLPDEVESLSIDGKQIGDGDTLGKLHTDEIYDLAVKLREEDKNSESDNGDAAAADSDSSNDAAANEDAVNTEAADQTATDPWDTVLPVAETIEIPEEAQPLRTYDMYQLTFMQSENLPALYIDTENGTMDYLNQDKTHWEPGEMVCLNEDGTLDSEGEIRKIHGRGNTSWGDVQKGYTFITQDECDILTMGNSCKWKLLVSGFDSTRLHQIIPMSFAKDIGLPYAVDVAYIDVFFNGKYNGNYVISEAIEVGRNRMELGEGDYLLEYSAGYDAGHGFNQDNSHPWEIHYPEDPSSDEIVFIRQKVNYLFRKIQRCSTLKEYNELKKYIDLDSFAKLYLTNMVGDDGDQNEISMFYYYTVKDDKFHACSAWDFNYGMSGDYRYNSYGDGPAEWLTSIPEYEQLLKEVYIDHEEAFDKVKENTRNYIQNYRKSQLMASILFDHNVKRWGMAENKYNENSERLIKWVDNRISLIKDTVMSPQNYCRVWIRSDYDLWHWNYWNCNIRHAYWVEKGGTIPESFIESLIGGDWVAIQYENGASFDPEAPIDNDMNLTLIHADVTDPLQQKSPIPEEPSSTDEQPAAAPTTTTVIQEQSTEKGDIIMALLGIILLATPGIISLMICGDLRDIKKSKIPGLIAEYLVFEFLTFLISYGIITILKGSVTISFAGISRGETYTIFHSNVVFLMAALFLASSVALGLLKPYYDYAKAGLIKRLPSPDVLDRVITKGQLSDENTSKKET